MLRYALAVLGATGVLLLIPGRAAANVALAQNARSTTIRIWTNADLDRLRAEDLAASQNAPGAPTHLYTNADTDRLHGQDLISTFVLGPAEQAEANEAVAPPEAQAEAAAPRQCPCPPKFQDPEWYAEQALKLNAQLAIDKANLENAEAALAAVRHGATEPGIDLFEGNPGITPEAGIQNLAQRVRDDEIQIDQLSDLARENGIAPGVLRT